MSKYQLEHINITVSDNEAFAKTLTDLFGWQEKWRGRGMEGHSILIGSDSTYVALYTPDYELSETVPMYKHKAALNHIGIITDDLDKARDTVVENGFTIHTEVELAPTKRLYFFLQGVEIEVAEYMV